VNARALGSIQETVAQLCALLLRFGSLTLLLIGLKSWAAPDTEQHGSNNQRSLILVLGAAGDEEYAREFSEAANQWTQAAKQGEFRLTVIGQDESTNSPDTRVQLLNVLTKESSSTNDDELWLVLIGHGTFDGRSAKFNLRGPDLSAEDLKGALASCKRPLAIINCASSSSPFLPALSGSNRVIVTATRSGHEANATRFGKYLARAITDGSADLDKDGQTSLLEAFILASRQVEQFYREEARLATEHALLDDNGDTLGTAADWFRGVRAVKIATGGKSADGIRAHQFNLVRSEAERELPVQVRNRRDELERALSALREQKPRLDETNYYAKLESVLLEIAQLYAGVGTSDSNTGQHPESNAPAAK